MRKTKKIAGKLKLKLKNKWKRKWHWFLTLAVSPFPSVNSAGLPYAFITADTLHLSVKNARNLWTRARGQRGAWVNVPTLGVEKFSRIFNIYARVQNATYRLNPFKPSGVKVVTLQSIRGHTGLIRHFFFFWHSATLALSHERQSGRMSIH